MQVPESEPEFFDILLPERRHELQLMSCLHLERFRKVHFHNNRAHLRNYFRFLHRQLMEGFEFTTLAIDFEDRYPTIAMTPLAPQFSQRLHRASHITVATKVRHSITRNTEPLIMEMHILGVMRLMDFFILRRRVVRMDLTPHAANPIFKVPLISNTKSVRQTIVIRIIRRTTTDIVRTQQRPITLTLRMPRLQRLGLAARRRRFLNYSRTFRNRRTLIAAVAPHGHRLPPAVGDPVRRLTRNGRFLIDRPYDAGHGVHPFDAFFQRELGMNVGVERLEGALVALAMGFAEGFAKGSDGLEFGIGKLVPKGLGFFLERGVECVMSLQFDCAGVVGAQEGAVVVIIIILVWMCLIVVVIVIVLVIIVVIVVLLVVIVGMLLMMFISTELSDCSPTSSSILRLRYKQ